MQQAPTIFVILFEIAGLLSAYLAAWAQFRDRVPAAREFSYMMLATAVYSLGFGIEISRTDLAGILAAIRFEYLGISFLAPLFFLFALHFIRQKPLVWYWVIALMLVPLITLVLVFTVEYHSWFYINPRVIPGEFFSVIKFERGVWYYVHFFYLQLFSLISATLLVIQAFRAEAKQKNQAILIAAGSIVPTTGAILYILDLIPGNLDPGPFTLSITGLIFSIALFKLGLFELVPAARELALDSIKDSFLVLDKHRRLQDYNKATLRLPGAQELKIGEVLPTANSLAIQLRPLLELDKNKVEFSTTDMNSNVRYYQAWSYPILTNSGRVDGEAILISDVSETVGLMRQLKDQANTDALTGLLNRRYLMEIGSHEIHSSIVGGQPLGVIMIDLDHFKMLNDRYGHVAGDEVLKSVAACFQKGLRSGDILGRYGGEEFTVFLPASDLNITIQVAERIRRQLECWAFSIEGKEVWLTASFGVYSAAAKPDATIDDFLKIADLALYQAKAKDRNQVAWISGE